MSTPYASTQPWADPHQTTAWSPSPPRPSHGLAVTALVVSCIAVVLAVVALLIMTLGGGSVTLEGTAPQVVTGRPYPGPRLAAEASAVLQEDGADVTSLTCPVTPLVEPGARTTCTGTVDGARERVFVSFTDTAGHFTLSES